MSALPYTQRLRVERDALHELEADARLFADLEQVLRVLGVSKVLKNRLTNRLAAVQLTLRREWNVRRGGKRGDPNGHPV